MVKDIKIEDYDYNLPDDRIPRYPMSKRDDCKLLVRTGDGNIYHHYFKELPDLLPPGSMVVCNDTKVIKARLTFYKSSGAAIEIFLLEPLMPSDYALNFQSIEKCVWKCLVGNLKKWKDGDLELSIPDESRHSIINLYARKLERLTETGVAVEFHWNNSEISFSQLIESAGIIPIPPYLHRDSEESDLSDYQTVYAQVQGSVAAPTAGLHFTPEVFKGLENHDVKVAKLTLHVGAGTFRPVKSETIGDHEMHSERFAVDINLIESIYEWMRSGKPIVAVGTTTVRTLESLPYIAEAIRRKENHPYHLNQWKAYADPYEDFVATDSLKFLINHMRENNVHEINASTSIMIAPGFKWNVVDAIVTNFHQPKSTLLLLVSSFLKEGNENSEAWRKVYDEALQNNYRFLSYGDASLLFIKNKSANKNKGKN